MGTTVHTLTVSRATLAPFPLPPLAEQRRIVAKVDELMALCDELEERQRKRREVRAQACTASHAVLAAAETPQQFARHWKRIANHFDLLYDTPQNVKELRQLILQLAVQGKLVEQNPADECVCLMLEQVEEKKKQLVAEGKIGAPKGLRPIVDEEMSFAVPDAWRWVRLGGLTTFGPRNGYSPKSVEYETPVKSLTLTATTSGMFDSRHTKFIAEDIDADSHLWLEDGDILIQRSNTLAYVGMSAVFRGPSGEYMYPDLMMKIRMPDEINIDYIHLVLLSPPSRQYCRESATGTSDTMRKINQAVVNNLPIPMPPQEEQRRIVAKLDQLMALCDDLESKLAQSETDAEKLMEAVVAGVLNGESE